MRQRSAGGGEKGCTSSSSSDNYINQASKRAASQRRWRGEGGRRRDDRRAHRGQGQGRLLRFRARAGRLRNKEGLFLSRARVSLVSVRSSHQRRRLGGGGGGARPRLVGATDPWPMAHGWASGMSKSVGDPGAGRALAPELLGGGVRPSVHPSSEGLLPRSPAPGDPLPPPPPPHTAQTAVRTSITTGTPPGSILTATPRTICPARRPAMISGQRVSERREHKTQKTATGPQLLLGGGKRDQGRGATPPLAIRENLRISAQRREAAPNRTAASLPS